MCRMGLNYLLAVLALSIHVKDVFGNECAARLFDGAESVVCVCNSTYCDTQPSLPYLEVGQYTIYTSSKDGLRFHRNTSHFDKDGHSLIYDDDNLLLVNVDLSEVYQEIIGFGGAFTDAATMNIMSLTNKTQDNLIQSYYSSQGIEYSLGRVPMASCDFSTRIYSYNDVDGDFDMKNFSLTNEDLKFKIPVITKAMNLSKLTPYPMILFASPWSAPAWMKTNNNMTGKGTLKGSAGDKYHKAWANYFVRFLNEYSRYNITFWGVTVQNEPSDGNIYNFPFQATGWTPETMRDFVKKDLGPALHQFGFKGLHVMILDDQRLLVEEWTDTILSDTEAAQYISGIAVHWYIDLVSPPVLLDDVHRKHPDKFILGTEACQGSLPWEKKVILGSWQRAESYSHDIIQDLNHWVGGWTDWNIALNMNGGPNWVKNFVDSPVIVNTGKDEFYKQPMFYVMGHFSKFVKPGSRRIKLAINMETSLEMVAFIVPQKAHPDATVVIISNRESSNVTVKIQDAHIGNITTTVPAHSIQTYIWWTK